MLDLEVRKLFDTQAKNLETLFEGHVISYIGEIHPYFLKQFRNSIETLSKRSDKTNKLIFFLNTPGGSAETTEHMADIIRKHYQEVHFVVAENAMSAGTILCMSGDKIYMDYASSLGPIDPQVLVQEPGKPNQFVPALGYLDKVEELIKKSADGTITPVEFERFQRMDLATLRRYEMARNLSIALLKKWLVKYKFKSWEKHQTDTLKNGQPVTDAEKEKRAEEIAEQLSDHNKWHSHARRISIETLQSELRLQIEDFGKTPELQESIRLYNDIMFDYVNRQGYSVYIHFSPD